jgi:PAS domain S-box-containing protein
VTARDDRDRGEERYRSLFQHMLSGFAFCRMIFENNAPRDFIYLEVNPAFEALTGLKDVSGKKVSDVIPGIQETNPELFETYGRVSRTGVPEKLVTYVPELKIWFSISVYSPQQEHFVAVFDNITERKHLEQSLEEEKALLLTLINSLPDQVYVKDREGRFVLANKALADFVGVGDPELLIGRTDHDFYSPDLAERCLAEERRIIESGVGLFGVEEPARALKGELHWRLTTKVPVRGEGGAVTSLVGSHHDITQRKLDEQKQREQAALLDIATDAILVRDLGNRIIYWNKGAERIYGWNRDEAREKDADTLLFGPTRSGELADASAIVMEKGEWSGELHPTTRDGHELTVEARLTLVRDSRNAPTGILSVHSDITERRAIQSQLLRVQRLESLGTLAGGIAHDLNNVLSPILMGVEGLSIYSHNDSSKKILEIIKTAAQRGASIVRQVLSFARGVGGERAEVQLKHVLRELEQIMEETFPKAIEIRTDIPKDLPPVVADATQIHQVLMNLCVNARDAMPDGGRLTLSAEKVHVDETYARMHIEAKPIDYIVLKVEDTGAGMPPAVADKIFDPFFTTKDPGKGTGLGLSTALTIVKSHGGFINVYSEINKGSSFKVYLPASLHETKEDAEEVTESIPMGEGELILVVDDEAAVREIARQILESYGYHVLTAGDGTEAVALFAQKKEEIRAVVTDMVMPYMDGAATVRALRRIDPEVKVIATSGLLASGQSKATESLGVREFLAKPYTADTLLETLKRVLESATPRA